MELGAETEGCGVAKHVDGSASGTELVAAADGVGAVSRGGWGETGEEEGGED